MDIFNFVGTGPLAIIVAVVILVLIASYVASRYKVANANEALIISGARGNKVRDEQGQLTGSGTADKGIKVVVGGGTVVMPLVHKVGRLKLTARQISISLTDAVTSQGIGVEVQGVATFKIGRDIESIRNAAERFLDTGEEELDSIVKNVLEGSLRAIVGTLTVEDLIRDRQKLLQQVQDAAKGDLETSGLQIDSFTIQSLRDQRGYIDQLGAVDLAKVQRDAKIAQAQASQETAIKEAEAEQIKINAAQDVALRKAAADTETEAAAARAAQAAPLAQAEAEQEVIRKRTELAQLEAQRVEQELVARTVKPAEAEAEAVIKRAEGERQAAIARASAEAEKVRLAGQAEADAVEAKGSAEAQALSAKAAAYREFDEAAVMETILANLPAIVAAAAEPMKSIDSLTVLSGDGASEIVRTGARTAAETLATVKGLTGLDIGALIGKAVDGRSAAKAAAARPVGSSDDAADAPAAAPAAARPAATPTPAPAPVPAAVESEVAEAAAEDDADADADGRAAAAAAVASQLRSFGTSLSGSQRRVLEQMAADPRFASVSLNTVLGYDALPRALRAKVSGLMETLSDMGIDAGKLTVGRVVEAITSR